MTVLVDVESVWLTMETSNVKKLVDVIERMIVMEDVVHEDLTGTYESIGVIGPAALSVLEACLGEPLNLEKEYQHREFADCPFPLASLRPVHAGELASPSTGPPLAATAAAGVVVASTRYPA